MSRENVEVTYRAYDAVNRRDLDALLALTDPEVVAVPRVLAVEGGTLRGHDGMRAWWDGVFSAFPDFNIEVNRVREIDDVTVASIRVRGHGHGSGTPFVDAVWHVSRFRNGKVVWWQTCRSEAEALEAVGLGE
jgi:ketosteroid isomerase-like protein